MAKLFTRRIFSPAICSSCRIAQFASRPFTTSSVQRLADNRYSNANISNDLQTLLDTKDGEFFRFDEIARSIEPAPPLIKQPHRFHVYSTKHNTHITLVGPNTVKDAQGYQVPAKDQSPRVLISLSSGNIGFRKAGRGKYDAAYQLAAYVLKSVKDRGLLREIKELEVVLRGFGPGREAVTKAILGSEGKEIRGLISGVKDATRLKFGGTRSPKPRRLG